MNVGLVIGRIPVVGGEVGLIGVGVGSKEGLHGDGCGWENLASVGVKIACRILCNLSSSNRARLVA